MGEQAPAIVGVAALAIDFLRVPEPKTVKNRLHLDLRSTDLAAATEQVLALMLRPRR
jgi:hypothetical protein